MSTYEFSKEEETVFNDMTKWMLMLSGLLTIAGILSIIHLVINPDRNYFLLYAGLTWFLLGLTFYFPTDNFRRITKTEGNDIKELMTGFEELDQGWKIANIILGLNRLFLVIIFFMAIY